jgi:asparagine synthase (glutamine-hydrolysing)
MLRGQMFASLPFFNQKAVIELLDRMSFMDDGARTATDQILMVLVSLCVLHERFGLAT